jgi:hypothetical protein
MGYIVNPLLTELRPELVARFNAGELIRRGGLLVVASGRPNGGQIAAHLRDILSGPSPSAMSSVLQLSQVAAAASVLNLGVSVVGFAVLAHKMGKLQDSLNALTELTRRNHDEIMGALGGISEQLVELRYIALDSRELLVATLDEVRRVRQDLLDSYLARVLTEIDLLRRTERLSDETVHAALRTFGEARRWLDQTIRAFPAHARDDSHWLDRLLRFRVWCLAGVSEVQLLRRTGADADAADLARQLGATSRGWAHTWRDALMPVQEFHGAFRFAHGAFKEMPREVYVRLVRLHDGTILGGTDGRELGGRMAVAREMPALGGAWVERQFALAGLLDFVEEATARLESTSVELTMCSAERLRYQDWEALPTPANLRGLAAIETGA